MDPRNDLFVYIGACLATIVGLFAAQLWYESYLDVAVIHAQDHAVAADAKLSEVRAAEEQKLSSGRVPIAQAMSLYAQRGRAASPKLAVKPSEDLSAMAGWIHRPNFAPYVPRKPASPPAAPAGAEVAPGAEGVPPAEGAPGQAAPAAEGAEQGAAPAQPGAAPAAAVAAAPAAPAVPAAEAAQPGKPAAPAASVRVPRPSPARVAPATSKAP